MSNKLATLNTIQPMLDSIVSSDLAVVTLKNVLSVLTSQIVELKTEVVLDSNKHHDTFIRTVKNEQYSRRNTAVLVGLPADPSESPTSAGNLVDIVAKKLTEISGTPVKPENFSAVHRNGPVKDDSARSTRHSNTKIPSITVYFFDSNQKDKVLQNYSNFDKSRGKSRDVRLYQSLSKFYTDLKSSLSSEIESKLGKNKLKWIHWRSQSTGFVVKLKDDRTFKKIFCLNDFLGQLQ